MAIHIFSSSVKARAVSRPALYSAIIASTPAARLASAPALIQPRSSVENSRSA